MPALPKPKRVDIWNARKYIKESFGLAKFDEVNPVLFDALVNDQLHFEGELNIPASYDNRNPIRRVERIPCDFWKDWGYAAFNNGTLSDSVVSLPNQDNRYNRSFYTNLTIATADIDAWKAANSENDEWHTILGLATQADYLELEKSDTTKVCKLACLFAGYRPENLHVKNANRTWLDSISADSSAGTPGYFMGILGGAIRDGKLTVAEDHLDKRQVWINWRDAVAFIKAKNISLPDALLSLGASSQADDKSLSEKPLGTRAQDSLLKMVIGMAVAGYKYNPSAQRNNAVADIKGDLEGLGIPLDDETIRKWLRQAAELLPATVDEA